MRVIFIFAIICFSYLFSAQALGESKWKLLASLGLLDLKKDVKGDCLFAIFDEKTNEFIHLDSTVLKVGEKVLNKEEGFFMKKKTTSRCSIKLDGSNSNSSDENLTFLDERDNKTYKLVKLNNLLWFSEDYEFEYKNDENKGSTLFTNESKENGGRLYSWIGAYKSAPKGFRLPTPYEWESLFRLHFTRLLVGGSSGLNLNSKPFSSCSGVNQCSNGAQAYWSNEFSPLLTNGEKSYDIDGYTVSEYAKYIAIVRINSSFTSFLTKKEKTSNSFLYVRYVKQDD